MNYQQRIESLAKLSDIILTLDKFHPIVNQAYINNNWFTPEMQIFALKNWASNLQLNNITKWLNKYEIKDHSEPKTIGIIMAGNIPLVGLHDLLCVLATGNKALIKTSGDDETLIKFVVEHLIKINPEFANYITLTQTGFKTGFDAVIATGSNNTNRYFEYYFKNKPHLLRKNRNSIAILTGFETPDDYQKLADDIFLYFGLGCRNISKIFVPNNFDFNPFFEGLTKYADIINHNKYANNYTYHKAIFLMNQTPHLDNGFLLLKKDEKIASPLSVLFFDYYSNVSDVEEYLIKYKNDIQCIVSKQPILNSLPFGSTQETTLTDYADGVDTIEFLLGISH
ncbi:MAG: acyl-CoA reductase [Bacteroidia bacterium]